MTSLNQQFQEYTVWRDHVSAGLTRYLNWLNQYELNASDIESTFLRAQERLRRQKLSVAFVADFSRGKSELINAIFFASYGRRILPSSAGRTTMCPTELLYHRDEAPCIKLLPIETRAEQGSVGDCAQLPHLWQVIPLDIDSPTQLNAAISRVAESKKVTLDLAQQYGLYSPEDPDQAAQVRDGMIEISAWRHAVINVPHPILMQGLVVIDTPGLNAIGSEPELTLNLIPNADAVLFILAADTGVTKSDIEIWRKHIGGPAEYGRLAVLNKIDSMWDELRSPEEVEEEIRRQITQCADILGLEQNQLFAISAQKGLVAKVQKDRALLEKSRLSSLEHALSRHLVPQRKRIVTEQLLREIDRTSRNVRAVLKGRSRDYFEQLLELKAMRGKNKGSIDLVLARVEEEGKEFEQVLKNLHATRQIFGRLADGIFQTMGMESARRRIAEARKVLAQGRFLKLSIRADIKEFFANLHHDLSVAEKAMAEIVQLIEAMTQRFVSDHAMTLPAPMPMTLRRYHDDLLKIEQRVEDNILPVALISFERSAWVSNFFESIASRVKACYAKANGDVDAWLKSLTGPIESQTREHQRRLRHRLGSVKKVQEAHDQLEQRIAELEQAYEETEALLQQHDNVAKDLRELVTELLDVRESQSSAKV